jgi:tetratricopeptide (TPR) repeat protein
VLWEEALGLASELGNAPMRAPILGELGHLARYRGEYEEARRLHTESVGLMRKIRRGPSLAWFLGILGSVEAELGECERARAHGEEALALYRDGLDRLGMAVGLTHLASLSVIRGDYAQAVRLAEKAVELTCETEEQLWLQDALVVLGIALTEVGDTERAREVLVEGLTRSSRSGYTSIVPEYLEGLAGLFTTCGQVERAARLYGAAEAAREHPGAALSPSARVRHEGHRESGRTQLGGAIWQAAWEEGQAMTLVEAIECALDDGSETIPRPDSLG